MNILYRIHSSADVKNLTDEELDELASEIRAFLVESISHTGGHLASNLGIVELTLALHRVYDTSSDRIVFDVGHQSYVHKMLTGRWDRFSTLRQYAGLSGFPKPYESSDDAFIAGHASNSVSVAVGMAKARTALHKDYQVVAVLGDGALTGGLAYEGLAAAAASKEPMVIVLNDNNMSIAPNVGGIARLLQNLRIRPGYIRFKKAYREMLKDFPGLYSFTHELKEDLKDRLLPANTFSAMGLNYIGPVDGHNRKELEFVLQLAREMNQPVLVHVLTQKGKGCIFAEKNPERYHGVGPYDPITGSLTEAPQTYSDVFGKTMCSLAEKEERMVAISAAMSLGTGLAEFAERYPERFCDVGIAEGHACSMAAGMAKQGLIPVFAVYSSFLQRGFDMMIHDIGLLGLHVVFCIDRAGIVGGDGETHHGIFDISYLRTVPGMKIYAPASFRELSIMLEKAVLNTPGPVAIRYPRGEENSWKELCPEKETIIRSGCDLTIVAYGSMLFEALHAAELLEEKHISAEVVKLSELDGKDFPLIMDSIRKTHRLLLSEEVCEAGCIGYAIAEAATEEGIPFRSRALNLGEGIVPHGDRRLLMRDFGIDAEAMVLAAKQLVSDNLDE